MNDGQANYERDQVQLVGTNLKGEWPLDDVLANIVLLGQVEQLPDLAGTLGSQPARDGVVGQSGNLSLSLLDDGHGQDREVAVDDAPADRLPLALSILARAVAGGALLQQQPHPAVGQDTLKYILLSDRSRASSFVQIANQSLSKLDSKIRQTTVWPELQCYF